ncbi:hypothetical protein [Geomesophilobacter sediminis]|uniref:Uncharacterized protein n=1 Tax=Geomesophilobacter sediminis TaxID=2798584 RepID=A0A8J7IRR8_9BACT|nr:hypothetical protein [Geomesophilobacter sediminis]MBJ6725734.1 hypothetical protein [Geomesophilobacter sediminis]
MALGQNGFLLQRGDLVKVVGWDDGGIPLGTVAPVREVLDEGRCLLLGGRLERYVHRSRVEVLSYAR